MGIQQAKLAVMAELKSVSKDRTISTGRSGGSYQALSYDNLIDEIQPFFVKHKITMTVSCKSAEVKLIELPRSNGEISVNFMCSGTWTITFSHADGGSPYSSESVDQYAYALDTSDKADGKACTYATKQAIVKCFSIKSGSEDEEERVVETEDRHQPPSEKQILFIQKLGKQKGKSGTIPKTMTEAKKLIDELMKLPDAP